jgi:hypothetical protein
LGDQEEDAAGVGRSVSKKFRGFENGVQADTFVPRCVESAERFIEIRAAGRHVLSERDVVSEGEDAGLALRAEDQVGCNFGFRV